MAQVALAWSLSKPFISAPIVGTTSLDKLKDLVGTFFAPYRASKSVFRLDNSAAGIHVKLTEEEIKTIDDLYRSRAVEGHR